MTASVKPIAALDVPLSAVEAEAERIWAERERRVAALYFRQAATRTASPSDRIAFALDAHLIREQVPVSTDADYPGWAEHIAALQAANLNARKEASHG
ncbi:hypothetical protein ACFYVK_35000 [Streptomyces chartreusis]|uniref:hypothetical protein n=1 Tax=Streptomyces chartreusis TaxID=1969 RepID=UPI0036C63404